MFVRMPRFPASLSHGALLLGLMLSFGGCHARSSAPIAAVVPVRSASGTADAVRSSPLYQQARQACKRYDYRRAADLLQTLAKTPDLTPDAVAFCSTQRTLCLQEAGLLPKKSIATPSLPVPADADCGPRALLLVCQKLGVRSDLETLRKLAGTTAKGTTMEGLQQAAEKLGLKAEGVQVSREALTTASLPALAWTNRNHYVALLALSGTGDQARATIHDPNRPSEETLSQEQLLQRSGGFLLLIHR